MGPVKSPSPNIRRISKQVRGDIFRGGRQLAPFSRKRRFFAFSLAQRDWLRLRSLRIWPKLLSFASLWSRWSSPSYSVWWSWQWSCISWRTPPWVRPQARPLLMEPAAWVASIIIIIIIIIIITPIIIIIIIMAFKDLKYCGYFGKIDCSNHPWADANDGGVDDGPTESGEEMPEAVVVIGWPGLQSHQIPLHCTSVQPEPQLVSWSPHQPTLRPTINALRSIRGIPSATLWSGYHVSVSHTTVTSIKQHVTRPTLAPINHARLLLSMQDAAASPTNGGEVSHV